MDVKPLHAAIGAEISGVDIGAVDDALFDAILDTWHQHAVLRFRDQKLNDDSLQAFSRRLGPLEYAPHGRIRTEDLAKIPNPYITTISNVVENGRPIGGLGSGEAAWHTDMSYIEHPPTASLLYAVEVPDNGGDTHFCSMYAAYDALPAALRKRIQTLSLKHDAAHDSVGNLRRGFDHTDDPADAPGSVHPIVKPHPVTGRATLFLGRRQDAYVQTLDLAESEALIDEIWEYVALPDHVWTQSWRVGDLIMWDNRCVMHRRAAFDASSRRLMRRTQVRPKEVSLS